MTLAPVVQSRIADIDERWKAGIRLFERSTEEFIRKKSKAGKTLKRLKTIRTAVYGDIHLDEDEVCLVDSLYLQRLRHVSQMGLLHLVFPEARHSRFEHSIGVLWRTKQLLGMKNLEEPLRDYADVLRIAALLHDIGHGPFSHSSERMLQSLGADRRLRGELRYHESRCWSMLTDQLVNGTRDFHLKRLELKSYGLRGLLEEIGCQPTRVAKIVNGSRDQALSWIINGPVDVDKLDYLRRDAYYTGAPPGGIDPERLITLMRWKLGQLGFDEKGIRTLLQFAYARPFTSAMTISHPVVRIVEAMLLVAFDLALELIKDSDLQANVLGRLELMDDNDLVGLLEIVSGESRRSAKGKSTLAEQNASLLADILTRLRNRQLWKSVMTLSSAEFVELTGRKNLQELFEFLTDREILWAPAARLAGELGLPADPPLAVVFALTSRPRTEEKIVEFLKDIVVFGERGARTLFECCTGQRHAEGIEALQDDLWNVIVIAPEGLRSKLENEPDARKALRLFAANVLREPHRLRPSPSLYLEALAKLEDWVSKEWGSS